MKIEDQVCTLKQAKKLNELGVIQGCSLFFFDGWSNEYRIQFNSSHKDGYYKDAESCFSAFTVAELSVMLLEYAETYFSKNGTWRIEGSDLDFDTQVEASAYMLIHLIENNILDINEVNERLIK